MEELIGFLAADSLQGRLTGTPGNTKAAHFISKQFQRAGLKPVAGSQGYLISFETRIKNKLVSTQNVIAELPGKTKRDEVIVFCAHYDHVGTDSLNPYPVMDGRASQPGDTIYNGANDNASGVAGIIALAKYFGRLKNNERTILFIAFSGEELGMRGSYEFVKNIKRENFKAVLNLEMLGRSASGEYGKPYITGARFSDLPAILNKGLENANRKIYSKGYFEDDIVANDLFYRSDNLPFAELNITAHTIMAGGPSDPHYHSVEDELETLNSKQIADIVLALALGSAGLIDGSVTPNFHSFVPAPAKHGARTRE
ncbi:MAG: M20/M25/M40 family metallo-hydrolase [Chitinophagaceae bacterium]